MTVPSVLIALPCLTSFVLSCIRYYQRDPARRLTDPRFVNGAGAILILLASLASPVMFPGSGLVAPAFLLLALGSLGYAVILFRQGGEREKPAQAKPQAAPQASSAGRG